MNINEGYSVMTSNIFSVEATCRSGKVVAIFVVSRLSFAFDELYLLFLTVFICCLL